MKIQGIHIGHDSGASSVIDGKIIVDVAEERFVRIKHFAGLPVRSIEYCLKAGKISIDILDYIAIPSLQSDLSLGFLFENMPFSDSYSMKIKKGIKNGLTNINNILFHTTKFPLKNVRLPVYGYPRLAISLTYACEYR